MGWIRFDIRHGGGHQGSDTIYEHFKVAKKGIIEEHIEYEIFPRYRDCTVTPVRIKRLPKIAQTKMITIEHNKIERSKKRIELLRK